MDFNCLSTNIDLLVRQFLILLTLHKNFPSRTRERREFSGEVAKATLEKGRFLSGLMILLPLKKSNISAMI